MPCQVSINAKKNHQRRIAFSKTEAINGARQKYMSAILSLKIGVPVSFISLQQLHLLTLNGTITYEIEEHIKFLRNQYQEKIQEIHQKF